MEICATGLKQTAAERLFGRLSDATALRLERLGQLAHARLQDEGGTFLAGVAHRKSALQPPDEILVSEEIACP